LLLLCASGCEGGSAEASSKSDESEESGSEQEPNKDPAPESDLRLSSAAFDAGEAIPKQYTCDGEDRSPPLSWTGAPEGTRSFALIVDDPDAPGGTFVHWLAYGLPKRVEGLPAGVPPTPTLDEGGKQGRNDFGKIGYRGPCPPDGETHAYAFQLHALDKALQLEPGVKRGRLEEAMSGHVLAQSELMGRYERAEK
jgi:hypothetical protein